MFKSTDLLGSLFPFNLRAPSLRPGEVHGIDESGIRDAAVENLQEVIQGKSNYLDKDIFYLNNRWKGVSKESYQTKTEHEILSRHSAAIVSLNHTASIVIELGPSTFDKTRALLELLNKEKRSILYIAVDINQISLKEHIPLLNRDLTYITCIGLWGTFKQALNRFKPAHGTRGCIWSFGSSLSNGPPHVIGPLFRDWSQGGYTLLVGQDGTHDKDRIESAYHTQGFKDLILGRLKEIAPTIGQDIFDIRKWTLGCSIRGSPINHRFVITAEQNISKTIVKGTRIEIFASFKYTKDEMNDVAAEFGCNIMESFEVSSDSSRIYILRQDHSAALAD